MAAPRATQWIALRNLAKGSHQVRQLSMTGPATYASPILTKERSVLNLPGDLVGLRQECKRRKIETAGSKRDLIQRLNADELANSRPFSTIAEKARPTIEQSKEDASKPGVRHFNTSRSLKQVNDTSTIDFAFLPDVVAPESADIYASIRVPILPIPDAPRTVLEPEEEVVIMKPEISVMSADRVFLPLSESESHDSANMNIDFRSMADRVAANLRRMQVPVEQQAGVMKQIWGDMVDDVMGIKKKAATS